MPNGVICGGAVDGSNQLGEIVTCQAIVTLPDWRRHRGRRGNRAKGRDCNEQEDWRRA